MVKVLVILAHPDPSIFNQTIAKATVETLRDNGHEIFFHDLYKEKFTPLPSAYKIPKNETLPSKIELHCKEASEVDGFIIMHPNWWGMPLVLFVQAGSRG